MTRTWNESEVRKIVNAQAFSFTNISKNASRLTANLPSRKDNLPFGKSATDDFFG
jgi:hypothetical protein